MGRKRIDADSSPLRRRPDVLTPRDAIALLWVQVIGIGGVIVIDRTGIEPIAGIVATLGVAVCGWLLIAGPARCRQVRRLFVVTRQNRDLTGADEMSDRDGTMRP